MPKIIENLEVRLMEEARRQIEQMGYSAMTIRSVAGACGVGVGTVYNYFESKDAILAGYMLEDWRKCIGEIGRVSDVSTDVEPVLRCMYEQLCRFAEQHRAVFTDAAAAASFSGSFGRYHQLLRRQLAQPLEKFCDSGFAAEFAAEALLTWTMAGKAFEEIHEILGKLF